MKPYKDGVSLEDIIEDGWSRGFQTSQVIGEAHQMGYNITRREVMDKYIEYESKMEDFHRQMRKLRRIK